MSRILTIAANICSILLYPLWIPTISVLLYCVGISSIAIPLPPVYWWVMGGYTFFITALVPLIVILIGIRRGRITDIHICSAEQRTVPYIYTIVCYAFWVYFLICIAHVSTFFWVSAAGGTAALILTTLINLKWKISSHLCGWGAFIGGVMSFCLQYSLMPGIGMMSILSVVTLLLMYARLYLNAHDDKQVVAGFLLGLICTFLPNLCLSL